MRLTRRGVAVLVGAVCCYLVGELAGYPFFRAVAGVLLGAVLAAVVATVFRPKVEIERSVQPDRLERGTPALATLVVRNETSRRQGGFAADDRAGAQTRKVWVRPLAPGAEATYHYELPTFRRGRVQAGPLALNRFDPFGLARGDRTVGSTAFLWAYPRLHPARPVRAGHPRHHHDGPITDPPLRGSADLREVRQYVIGDEVRYLHWKATARTGQLMVRDYADPAQPRFTTVLDTRPGAMSPAMFEEAVEVAASLLYASAMAGQHCRLITPAGLDTPVDSGLRVLRTLLDELCLVAQDARDDEPLVPVATVTAARPGGVLAVITGPVADLGAARRWRPDTVIRLGVPSSSGLGWIGAPNAAGAVAVWNALGAK
ncbi:DUF58 domain-containing protein [Amycolatopsis taiwanensis]|uniref:DUF58 domain-containing protein n=1 Tax=Amycolatopsis taiwanensis TaxID=342230 RepID=A0A9W6VKF2_9PSEU|nr:DUF58 domain-containing protein [Amycolatopsis taiwanensis]GLY71630.1 hypothetical protein Atai01_82490 [Amycolatopsis taiwanensis]